VRMEKPPGNRPGARRHRRRGILMPQTLHRLGWRQIRDLEAHLGRDHQGSVFVGDFV
jgi:hypothetical protein